MKTDFLRNLKLGDLVAFSVGTNSVTIGRIYLVNTHTANVVIGDRLVPFASLLGLYQYPLSKDILSNDIIVTPGLTDEQKELIKGVAFLYACKWIAEHAYKEPYNNALKEKIMNLFLDEAIADLKAEGSLP